MIIKSFVFNPFQENCYILSNKQKESIIIDPGCCVQEERKQLADYIKINDLKIKHLLNTHLHLDHILGNKFIQDTYGVEAESAEEDEPLLENLETYTQMFGLIGRCFSIEEFRQKLEAYPLGYRLKEGDEISVQDIHLSVIQVPGHTKGHLAFYCKEEKICFVGDILFKGSIGRTDLTGGNERADELQQNLIKNIKNKILTLPQDTTLLCGHGPYTTVEQEIQFNPYFQ